MKWTAYCQGRDVVNYNARPLVKSGNYPDLLSHTAYSPTPGKHHFAQAPTNTCAGPGSPRRKRLAMTVWDAKNDERARGPFLLWSALTDGLDHRQLLVFHPHPIDHIAFGLRIHHQLIRCTGAVCVRAHHQRPHDRVPSTPPNHHPAQRERRTRETVSPISKKPVLHHPKHQLLRADPV